MDGIGCVADGVKARDWLLKGMAVRDLTHLTDCAAVSLNQQNTVALYYLGMLYLNGAPGIDRNRKAAFVFFNKGEMDIACVLC